MGFITRLFAKQRAVSAATEADRSRSYELAGRETDQTAAEQAATRGRMEAEMDAQRQQREHVPAPARPS